MRKPQKNPLITVSIPTRNSAQFLDICLKSLKQQTYKNYEVNIIDADSIDNTVAVAKKNHITNIHIYKKGLLGARWEGVKHAKGDYILFLDSDQVLKKNTLQRAVDEMKKNVDMVILGEDVYKNKTWIETLFAADRKLVENVKDVNPYTGVLLPRFYTTALLHKAFSKIPKNILEKVGGQDHAIIYFEAWKISEKVGHIQHAVAHIEPDTLQKLWRKFYRWGYTSVDAHFGKYDELLGRKERFRTGMFENGLIKESFMSIFLLLLKGIPYKLGYLRGKYRV